MGAESELAFSLGFDPRSLRFLGAGAAGRIGTLLVNVLESGSGWVGLASAGARSVPLGSGSAAELLFERIWLEPTPVLELSDAPMRRGSVPALPVPLWFRRSLW